MLDLVIIGAGPAGFSAAIYASCFKMQYVAFGQTLGGQVSFAPDILNYPGFEETNGMDLTNHMLAQVKKRGGDMLTDIATEIVKKDTGFVVKTQSGKEYETKTVILATGVERRKLNVAGETEYSGKGVFYCAKCDTHDYDNKICAVVGGANSAAQTTMQLAHTAKKVYIIYRGEELRSDPIWVSQIKESQNIEVIYNTQVSEIVGDGTKVTGLKLKSTKGEETKDLQIEQLYVEIGGVPGTALLASVGVTMDKGGFIDVNEELSTSVPGIFAAGDVTSHKYSIEQISSAVGLGARACVSAFSFIKQGKAPSLWGANQINRP
jgi:thioredoxin reductase (NADPH)